MKRKISTLIFLFFTILSTFAQQISEKEIKSNIRRMKREKKKLYYYIIDRSWEDRNLSISDYEIIPDVVIAESLFKKELYSLETVYYYKGLVAFLDGKDFDIQEFFFKKALEYNEENYQAKVAITLINKENNSEKLSEIRKLYEKHRKFYFEKDPESCDWQFYYGPNKYQSAYYRENVNLYLLQARCERKKKNLDEMDLYYYYAVRGASGDKKDAIKKEGIEAYEALREEIAHDKGFKTLAEYDKYQQRISADNLIGYLQVGSFEFSNGVPFEIGDEILIKSTDSEKLQIVDVSETEGKYIFLVEPFRPYEFSKCCYIISNQNNLYGEYKLKCIGMDNYTTFNNYGASKVNTYVFLLID